LTTPDSRNPADILDRSWDDNAEAWTATVRERRIESRRVATDRAIVDAVLRHSPGRLLDVGCGEGWLCRVLSEHAIQCVGVDGSSDLTRAAQSADPDGEYHLLRYDDFDRLAEIVKFSSTDLAVCNFALLHEEIVPILTAVHSVLRPRGILLIQTVHPWTASGTSDYVDGWRTEDFAWSTCCFPEPMPWYFRTLESWTNTIRDSGFVLDAVAEPVHPESKKPLSLLLSAVRPGV
jgi:2-polyprenyl-3-methyl-5-hydroxy-6-metoxy-1,4-benzoquinol methylase